MGQDKEGAAEWSYRMCGAPRAVANERRLAIWKSLAATKLRCLTDSDTVKKTHKQTMRQITWA